MSEFYDIDSTRVSHLEYWWGTQSPLVLVGWVTKWLRVRIPSSTDDPNVDSTLPFVCAGLPPDIQASFEPLAAQITALGFVEPVYHVISDAGTQTKTYWATFRHPNGQYLARIHRRVWQKAPKASRALFPQFMTAFADGTFLVSSAGKPDTAAPESVQMNRRRGAKPAQLLAEHEGLVKALSGQKPLALIHSREETIAAGERLHVLVRDFHLGRGVFRPRSAEAQAQADAFAAQVAQAQASGQEHAEVLAELTRLQEKKPGWRTTVWVLAGSLVVFLALGAAKWDWKFTFWIIPVLVLHEGGHWVAMRLFRYRNLRMFFIPLFGAAVTGQNWNVPGWKKALVSLAGPLPGIALGVVLGIASLVLKHPWLNHAALALLLLNGLNLLPILPLDGGHVLQDTLFCRNRWLDGAFRLLAILGLVLLGTLGGMTMLRYVAIAMAVSLPLVFRLSKVADDLRRQPLPPPLPGEDRIPTPTAQAIVSAVRGAFPARVALNNKTLAQHTLTVFERLNARPPGALATLSLLALHGGALLAALVVSGLLFISQQGGLGDFMAAAIRQPQHTLQPADTQSWPGAASTPEPAPRTLVVSTLKNRAEASHAFAELTKRVPRKANLTRLGDSLVLSLPAGDDQSREQWFEEFHTRCPGAFVALSNAPVAASLTFIAPTRAVATNLTRQLRDYFTASTQMRLVAPWSPEAKGSQFERWSQARAQWGSISRELAETWKDPSLKPYPSLIQAAVRRGSPAELVRLEKEQVEKQKQLQAQALERLRAGSPPRVAPALLDLHTQLHQLSYTNRAERKAVLRQVAAQLGEVRYAGEAPAPGATAWGVLGGTAQAHGLFIELRWLSFCDITRGFPALTQWLQNQGCRQFKYDFQGPGWDSLLDESDELGD